ncbi:hypothetical protein ScalyP_jg7105 [Parmales sp. scaly parma]|nr:hypothetical protein ScalyP_jg7105 [Parmales sp. scaly parma]
MADWDDDEWDVDDGALDAQLGGQPTPASTFEDEEEDLAVSDALKQAKIDSIKLAKKGNARLDKEEADKMRLLEEKAAKKALELEAEMEANMSVDERALMERKRIEDADMENTNDLFGGCAPAPDGDMSIVGMQPNHNTTAAAGDKVVLKDLKDHLKHAAKVGAAVKKHGKASLAMTFMKELLQECKDVMDEDGMAEIIKVCNVIKNEKAAKAKLQSKKKGQAQKSKKIDKAAEKKAKKMSEDLFGDNDQYDNVDDYGANYEDSFF